MFMKKTIERNPNLIDTAIQLHQSGEIQPDTYVLDVDTILKNARLILDEANKQGVELYFMLKQIGRNPDLAKLLIEAGFPAAVVVDFREAKTMMANHIPLGNVGHLVQIPTHLLREIMEYGTQYITIYSLDKLKEINQVAKELGITQKVLVRVVDEGDALYPGQYGGFELKDLSKYIEDFKKMKHIEIAGATSFPCFLQNTRKDILEKTNNADTILKAQNLLLDAGFPARELNMPSTTSVYTLPFIHELKGTQGEPGHALTGTTPMHAEKDLPEVPAYVYVSEVSHNFKGHAYLYGGGLYRRGNLKHVLFDQKGKRWQSTIKPLPEENIDYYLEVNEEEPVGTTAIMALRTQIFVTRSEVALVKGIQIGKPKIMGIYDSQGKYLRG